MANKPVAPVYLEKTEQAKKAQRSPIQGVLHHDPNIGGTVITANRMYQGGKGTGEPTPILKSAAKKDAKTGKLIYPSPSIRVPGGSGFYEAASPKINKVYNEQTGYYEEVEDTDKLIQHPIEPATEKQALLRIADEINLVVSDEYDIDRKSLANTLSKYIAYSGTEKKLGNIGKETEGGAAQTALKVAASPGATGNFPVLKSSWTPEAIKAQKELLIPEMQSVSNKKGRKQLAQVHHKTITNVFGFQPKKKEQAKGNLIQVADAPGGKLRMLNAPWDPTIKEAKSNDIKNKTNRLAAHEDFWQSNTVANKSKLGAVITGENWMNAAFMSVFAGLPIDFRAIHRVPNFDTKKIFGVADTDSELLTLTAKGLHLNKDFITNKSRYHKLGESPSKIAETIYNVRDMPLMQAAREQNKGIPGETSVISPKIAFMTGENVDNAVQLMKDLHKYDLSAPTKKGSPVDLALRKTSPFGARGYAIDVADSTLHDYVIDPNHTGISEIQATDFLSDLLGKRLKYDAKKQEWFHKDKKTGEHTRLMVDPASRKLMQQVPGVGDNKHSLWHQTWSEYTVRAPENNYFSGGPTSLHIAPRSTTGISGQEQKIGRIARAAIQETEKKNPQLYASLMDEVKKFFGDTKVITHMVDLKTPEEAEKLYQLAKRTPAKSGADTRKGYVTTGDAAVKYQSRGEDFDGDTETVVGITTELKGAAKGLYDTQGNFLGYGKDFEGGSELELQDDFKGYWTDEWTKLMGGRNYDDINSMINKEPSSYTAQLAYDLRHLPGYRSHEQDAPIIFMDPLSSYTDEKQRAKIIENREKVSGYQYDMKLPDSSKEIELPSTLDETYKVMENKYKLLDPKLSGAKKDDLRAEATKFLVKQIGAGETLRSNDFTRKYLAEETKNEMEHLSPNITDAKNFNQLINKHLPGTEFSTLYDPFEHPDNEAILAAAGIKPGKKLTQEENELGQMLSDIPALADIAKNWIYNDKTMATGDVTDLTAKHNFEKYFPFAKSVEKRAASFWLSKESGTGKYTPIGPVHTEEEKKKGLDAASLMYQEVARQFEQNWLEPILGTDKKLAGAKASRLFQNVAKSASEYGASDEEIEEPKDEKTSDPTFEVLGHIKNLSTFAGGPYTSKIKGETTPEGEDVYGAYYTRGMLNKKTIPFFEHQAEKHFGYTPDTNVEYGQRRQNIVDFVKKQSPTKVKNFVEQSQLLGGWFAVRSKDTFKESKGGISNDTLASNAKAMLHAIEKPDEKGDSLVNYGALVAAKTIAQEKDIKTAKQKALKTVTAKFKTEQAQDVAALFEEKDYKKSPKIKTPLQEVTMSSKLLSASDLEKQKEAKKNEYGEAIDFHIKERGKAMGLSGPEFAIGLAYKMGYVHPSFIYPSKKLGPQKQEIAKTIFGTIDKFDQALWAYDKKKGQMHDLEKFRDVILGKNRSKITKHLPATVPGEEPKEGKWKL